MDKVKSYIEKNKDRFLNELFELLRIPSISAQSDHKPDMTDAPNGLAASLMKPVPTMPRYFPRKAIRLFSPNESSIPKPRPYWCTATTT